MKHLEEILIEKYCSTANHSKYSKRITSKTGFNYIIDTRIIDAMQKAIDESHELVGYIFEDRFYKSIFELEGKTMNEENKPIAVFKKLY